MTPNRTHFESMLRLRDIRLAVVVAVAVSATFLTACGGDVQRTAAKVEARPAPTTTVAPMKPTTTTTTFSAVEGLAAAHAALGLAATFATAGMVPKENFGPGPIPRMKQTAAATSSGINWDCVATAETGGNWSMHGANYSTALGIMNQAVRENTDPATAARILAGQGSRAEQIAVADSIIHKFGFRAWAPSTVAKCS